MNLAERIAILFWFLLALFFSSESKKLGIGELSNPAPGFLPFVSGILLGLLSILLYLKNRAQGVGSKRKEIKKDLGNRKKIFWALGVLLFYCMFLDWLGFLLVTFVTMTFLYKKMGGRRWQLALFASFLTTAASYSVFQLWLLVNLPKGVLGF